MDRSSLTILGCTTRRGVGRHQQFVQKNLVSERQDVTRLTDHQLAGASGRQVRHLMVAYRRSARDYPGLVRRVAAKSSRSGLHDHQARAISSSSRPAASRTISALLRTSPKSRSTSNATRAACSKDGPRIRFECAIDRLVRLTLHR